MQCKIKETQASVYLITILSGTKMNQQSLGWDLHPVVSCTCVAHQNSVLNDRDEKFRLPLEINYNIFIEILKMSPTFLILTGNYLKKISCNQGATNSDPQVYSKCLSFDECKHSGHCGDGCYRAGHQKGHGCAMAHTAV